MSQSTYLQRLNERLAAALQRLPAETRQRHATWLQAAQNPDGGFSGREGGSDLYYTGFALRGLAVLDALTPAVCGRAADFLRGCLTQQTTVIDFFSLLYAALLVQTHSGIDVLAESPADWPERVRGLLESFRTADGGYGKATGSVSGSTYHTFLVGLCYEILGQSYPDPAAVTRFVLGRRREDCGFVELAPMKRSGTNPTAAAVGVLQILNSLSSEVSDGVVTFLQEVISPEGGMLANTRAPLADVLSTFTGSWTLEQLGAFGQLDAERLREYLSGVEQEEGGFRGGLWDERADVEYTFYGLGVTGLLSRT